MHFETIFSYLLLCFIHLVNNLYLSLSQIGLDVYFVDDASVLKDCLHYIVLFITRLILSSFSMYTCKDVL